MADTPKTRSFDEESLMNWKEANVPHHQCIITHEIFVRPADQNYVLARWMLVHGIYPESFWQTLQCIEKYLKAVLLLNGLSVKKYGHDIQSLWNDAREKLPEFLTDEFHKPEGLSDDLWGAGNVTDFVKRIHQIGDPDSRYGLTSWYRLKDDLFKLDQLAFKLRQVSVGLDWVLGRDLPAIDRLVSYREQTCAEAIMEEPRLMIRSEIADLARPVAKMGNDLGDILHSWNFEFGRSADDLARKAPSSIAPLIGPIRNSHIYMCWNALEPGRELPTSFIQAMNWLVDEVPMPKEDKNSFRDKLRQVRPKD